MYERELSYLAGFLDADGCITVAIQHTGATTVMISVASTTPSILRRFKRAFGGPITLRHNQNGRYPNARPLWLWNTQSRRAVRAVKALEPYLMVKRRQAHLALALGHLVRRERRRWHGTPPREARVRQLLFKELRGANRWRSTD